MFKTILNTLGTRIISALLGFIILILTTQFLGADGRGLISLLGMSSGIILIFTGFIGGSSLVYLTSRNELSYLLIPSYFWGILVSILGILILAFFKVIPDSILFPTFIISVISAISNVNLMVLIGKEKIKLTNKISFIQVFVNSATLIILFLFLNQTTISIYIFSLYLSNIIAMCLGFIAIRKYFVGFPSDFSKAWDVIKSMMSYGFFAQIGNVIQYLSYRASFFILNAYSGLAAVGIYSVGVVLSESIWMVSGSIALVEYSKISNSTDGNYARKLTIKFSKLSLIVTVLFTILLLCIPSGWFSIIFGKDFSTVSLVILTMSLGICSFGLTDIICHYFAGMGKYQINAIASLIGLIGTLIFSYLLIPPYGYLGAGITASISYLLTSVFVLWAFIRDTNTSLNEFYPRTEDAVYIADEIRNALKFKK